jgi:protein-S-isoprenylcysteine O-methyltransferase Ste14
MPNATPTTHTPAVETSRLLVLLSRWRINLGFLLAVPVIVSAHPTYASILWFLPLLVVGAAIRVWARGHLERQTQVTWKGPYAFVRHPLYVGSFVMAVAICGMTEVRWLPVLVLIGFTAMYWPKIVREERWMRQRFGRDYDAYAARVGALIPYPHFGQTPLDLPNPTTFAWRRVRRHREWKTILGALAIVAFLALRAAN